MNSGFWAGGVTAWDQELRRLGFGVLLLFATLTSDGDIAVRLSLKSSWASGSGGVGRSDRGRFPKIGRGTLGGGSETGDGERDGSFSLKDDSGESSSSDASAPASDGA